MFMTICNLTSFLRAGGFEGADFGMDAFTFPHLGHHFLTLVCGKFGIFRFTAAPAERDCGFVFVI
jgi:hypothetical protein